MHNEKLILTTIQKNLLTYAQIIANGLGTLIHMGLVLQL